MNEEETKNVAQNLADEIGEGFSDYLRTYPVDVQNPNIIFSQAQHQILRNDYAKCAQQRDEYKHQLNAANKEIKELKKELNHMKAVAEGAISMCNLSDKTDYDLLVEQNEALKDRVNEIDSDINRELKDELFTLKNDYAVLKHMKNKEIDQLKEENEKYRQSNIAYVKLSEGAKETIDQLKLEIDQLSNSLRYYQDKSSDNISKEDYYKLLSQYNKLVADEGKKNSVVDSALREQDYENKINNLNFTNKVKNKTLKNYEEEIDSLILKNKYLNAENTTLKEFTSMMLKNSAEWNKENLDLS